MAASLGGSVATKRHRSECRPRCPRTISAVSFRDIHQCSSEQILKANGEGTACRNYTVSRLYVRKEAAVDEFSFSIFKGGGDNEPNEST